MKKKMIIAACAVFAAVVVVILLAAYRENIKFMLLSPEEKAYVRLARQTNEEFISANHSNLAAHAEELIRMNPNGAEGYYWRGVIATMEGKFVEAIKHLEKAVELDPNHKDARAYLNWARDVQPIADPIR